MSVKAAAALLATGLVAIIVDRLQRERRTTVAPNFRELTPLPRPVRLDVGTTYLAQIEVGFPLSAIVDEQAIRKALDERGFVPISVTRSRPDFWPVASSADWYVVGTNDGATTELALPSQVTRMWEAVPG